MKRSIFFRNGLAMAALIMSPVVLAAKALKYLANKTGFFVEAGKDRLDKPLSLFEGDTFTCKVSSQDTDGAMYVFESIRVKEGGPSFHYHFDQDEWWYVLQGQFTFKVGDTIYHAKAGDSVFGPRKVPHTFTKEGDEVGKLIISFQPAGKMEAFFNKVSNGALKNTSEAEQDQLREAHGFKRVGPPLKKLKI